MSGLQLWGGSSQMCRASQQDGRLRGLRVVLQNLDPDGQQTRKSNRSLDGCSFVDPFLLRKPWSFILRPAVAQMRPAIHTEPSVIFKIYKFRCWSHLGSVFKVELDLYFTNLLGTLTCHMDMELVHPRTTQTTFGIIAQQIDAKRLPPVLSFPHL